MNLYPFVFLSPTPDCLGVKERHHIDKFEGEDEMLRRHEFHMKQLKTFRALGLRESWREMLDAAVGEQELKVRGAGGPLVWEISYYFI